MTIARIARLVALVACAALAPARADTDVELVQGLGAGAWTTRERAMRACLDRPSARALLDAASRGTDPEVRWRAKWALDALDWGFDAALVLELGNPFHRWEDQAPDDLVLALEHVIRSQQPARVGVLLCAVRRVSDDAVRAIAMTGLRQRSDAFGAWVKPRLASSVRETRTGAALVLALWGDRAGASVLEADLATGEPVYGRAATIEALIGLGEPAGLTAVLAAIRGAVAAKTLPSPREIEIIAGAPIGTAEVEAILLDVLEAAWGAEVDPTETHGQVLASLARCAGPGAVPRLLAWWAKDPAKRADAISLAVMISDAPGREALATRVAAALGGPRATPDDLFVIAALHRIAGQTDAHRKAVERLAAMDVFPSTYERIAEVAVTLLDAGAAKAAAAYLQKATKKTEADTGPLLLLWREAKTASGAAGDAMNVDRNLNNEAWDLVTHPQKLAHPGVAVRLAEWTVKNAGGDLASRGTQGAAYYRAGRLADAVRILEQNVEPAYHGKQEDIAFLAMAYMRLGRHEDARKIDAKCREWEAADEEPNEMRPELERVLREGSPPK